MPPKPTAQKIMLIRHGEKPGDAPGNGIDAGGNEDKESLTATGWKRAKLLASFFAPDDGEFEAAGVATPDVVYASKIGDGSESQRPQETVLPLVKKLKGKVTENLNFLKGQEAEVAAAAMQETGVVLIAWEHKSIPSIVTEFPICEASPDAPEKWPKGRYDVVWIYDLQDDCYVFSQVNQPPLGDDE